MSVLRVCDDPEVRAPHLPHPHFSPTHTYKGEGLRRPGSILRPADPPPPLIKVRRLAVRSAVGSCAPHSASLGSGWRTLLEVLRRAAADPEPSVAAEAMAPLQVRGRAAGVGGRGL